MNRRQQVLIRKRLVRPAAEKRLAGIGGFEFELRETQFERAEAAGVQCRLQQAFTLGEVLKNCAGLVLAAPSPDRGADDTYQRGRMERAFDEGHVAQNLSEPHGVGITFGTATLTR